VILLLVVLALPAPPNSAAAEPFDTIIQHDLIFAAQQLDQTARTIATNRYPSTTTSSGAWNTAGASAWTSGFFPGALWLMYERTNDSLWRTRAEAWTAGLKDQQNDTSTHDVGFKIFPSFGNGERLTHNDTYRQVLLTAAGSLSKRYDPDVGCVRSWGSISSTSNFEVIIDNMMNLELLFWASKHGGQAAWYDMAVSHALKTMANHVRADGSTYQIVNYNPTTGAIKSKSTKQGYNTESTWSRGQAWAVYGFTMAYRETGDARFLDTARKTADYFIAHLPSDQVPYWDFELPSASGQPRDSSAAAIAASGLIELSQRETDAQRGAAYLSAARDILTSLSSPAYLAEGTTNKAILLHGTQNKPDGKYDRGLIYGDYYFVEALLRYPTTPPPPDTTPPTVTARAPSPGAVDIPVGSSVTAAFSEAVANVSPSTFTLRRGAAQVAAGVSYDAATKTATLDPSADLVAGAIYTATLTNGIADLAGNQLVAVSWTFTTATAPPPPSGTRIKTITFEDGSLTHPTSGVDSINGSVTLITAGAIKGAYSARISNTSAYLQETFADADDIFATFYMRLDALPSADSRIVLFSNDGTTVGNLLLRSTGALQLRNASTAIGPASAALQVGAIYRIGLHQRRGSGANAILEAYLATGDSAFGAPFASSPAQTFSSAADRLRFGATTGALNAAFDDITLDAAMLP
jgi:unsaturated chondroitin disaccharide hydrolase